MNTFCVPFSVLSTLYPLIFSTAVMIYNYYPPKKDLFILEFYRGERQRFSTHCHTPQMAAAAREVAGAQDLGPSSATFPGPISRELDQKQSGQDSNRHCRPWLYAATPAPGYIFMGREGRHKEVRFLVLESREKVRGINGVLWSWSLCSPAQQSSENGRIYFQSRILFSTKYGCNIYYIYTHSFQD